MSHMSKKKITKKKIVYVILLVPDSVITFGLSSRDCFFLSSNLFTFFLCIKNVFKINKKPTSCLFIQEKKILCHLLLFSDSSHRLCEICKLKRQMLKKTIEFMFFFSFFLAKFIKCGMKIF